MLLLILCFCHPSFFNWSTIPVACIYAHAILTQLAIACYINFYEFHGQVKSPSNAPHPLIYKLQWLLCTCTHAHTYTASLHVATVHVNS